MSTLKPATPLFKVERISFLLKSYGVPDDHAYEVVAIFADRGRADGFATECRRLCNRRLVRVVETHLSTYGA